MTTSEGFTQPLTALGWDAKHQHIPYPHRDVPETETWTRGGWFEIAECRHPGGWIECNRVVEVRP